MKKAFLFFLLILPLISSADTLQVTFRYYDAAGHLVAGSNLKVTSSAPVLRTISSDEDAWQEVSWIRNSPNEVLRFIGSEDSLDIQVRILDKYEGKVKTLIIDRLQGGQEMQQVRINHLTCKFKGSIAHPLDYRFINPLDLHILIPDSMSTYEKGLQVLSDSVMLLHCGKNQGVFVKYYLGIDGKLELLPSPVECSAFKNESIRKLYQFIRRHLSFSYKIENNYLIIGSGVEEIRLFISG